MTRETSAANVPPPHTVLWRYLENSKFVDLLLTQEAYFRRSDLFKDSLEAQLPSALLDSFLEVGKRFDEISGIDNQATTREMFTKQLPATYFVSCWNIFAGESLRMWQEYGAADDSVAIEATVADLQMAFDSSEGVIDVGQVTYLDHSQCDPAYWLRNNDVCITVFAKSKAAFEWENEVRVVAYRLPPNPEIATGLWKASDANPPGIRIRCDLKRLIRKVYVKQACRPDALSQITQVILNAGLNVPILRSELI